MAQPSTDFAQLDMLPFSLLSSMAVLKCAPIYNVVSKTTIIIIILKKMNFEFSIKLMLFQLRDSDLKINELVHAKMANVRMALLVILLSTFAALVPRHRLR